MEAIDPIKYLNQIISLKFQMFRESGRIDLLAEDAKATIEKVICKCTKAEQ